MSHSRGISLVEILVAMVVTIGLMAAGMAIALSSRAALSTDQSRTAVNQNLRSGMDIVGFDLRQGGELLPDDVPALLILDGVSGAPDTVTVRRNLLDDVLPVCVDVVSGSSTDSVSVARKKGTIPAGCAEIADGNADGSPDNMDSWRDYRATNGGTVWAFIYNPTTKLGEFFAYDNDDEDSKDISLSRGNGGSWNNSYAVADQSRVYMLQERTFTLNNDILQYTENGQTSVPMSLVSNVSDFQARALFLSKAPQSSLDGTDDWRDLQSIEVSLAGHSDFHMRSMDRKLVSRFYPRNAQSQ